MHYVPFVMKRVHHSLLKVMRPIAARNDLTPARFDLLYTLHRDGRFQRFQSIMAKKLGLSRTTVCKMVGAMVKAGFLTRTVLIWDRRFRKIKLTKYGRRCFGRTMKELRRREIDYSLQRSLSPWPYTCTSRVARAARLKDAHATAQRAARVASGLLDTGVCFGALYPFRREPFA